MDPQQARHLLSMQQALGQQPQQHQPAGGMGTNNNVFAQFSMRPGQQGHLDQAFGHAMSQQYAQAGQGMQAQAQQRQHQGHIDLTTLEDGGYRPKRTAAVMDEDDLANGRLNGSMDPSKRRAVQFPEGSQDSQPPSVVPMTYQNTPQFAHHQQVLSTGPTSMQQRMMPVYNPATYGQQGFSMVMAGPGAGRPAPQRLGTLANHPQAINYGYAQQQAMHQQSAGDAWQQQQQRYGRLEGLGMGGGQQPGMAMGGSFRGLKPQDMEERQRAAQEQLQQSQPKVKQARPDRRRGEDFDSDEEEQVRDYWPIILSKVEEISEELKAKLGEGTDGDRYAGLNTSQDQVLVSREQVAEACGQDVAHALKGYQLVGINFLTILSRSGSVGGAILADEMGLGKTAQTIVSLGLLQHAAKESWKSRCAVAASATPPRPKPRGPRPHLIICPASLLENWQRELKQWGPKLRVVTYYGKDRGWIRDILYDWAYKADKAAEKRARQVKAEKAKAASAWMQGGGPQQQVGNMGMAFPGGAALDPALLGQFGLKTEQDEVKALEDDVGGSQAAGAAGPPGEDDDNSDEDVGVRVRQGRRKGGESEADSDEDKRAAEYNAQEEEQLFGYKLSDPTEGESAPFDVLITTYSLYERDGPDNKVDRQFISRFRWSHLVADEAHALKNRNSTRVQKLMRVARLCEHRVLLTGTPLQNDIGELLNLLRFLMPTLFIDEDDEGNGDYLIEELLAGQSAKDPVAQAELSSRVRRILSPFILRRLKSEVASQLVNKTHKLIEVDMVPNQAECYAKAVAKFKAEATAASTFLDGPDRTGTPGMEGADAPAEGRRSQRRGRGSTTAALIAELTGTGGGRRGRGRSTTPVPTEAASAGAAAAPAAASGPPPPAAEEQVDINTTFTGDVDTALSKLGSNKVNNIFSHLRKVALHPLLVRRRYSEQQVYEMAQIAVARQLFGGQCTMDRVLEEMKTWSDYQLHCFAYEHRGNLEPHLLPPDSVNDSGKLMALKSLLRELKEQGHRVLLFSQWTMMMDVMEWFLTQEGHTYVRLDGSTQVEERLTIVDRFNNPDNGIFLFLLSTRAGGQGLNLVGADTVVLHDVDFNPQVDRQAEDRCHRLGQTKPVTVYRMVTKGSVDRNIYEIAQRKLELDAAIIGQATATTADETEDLELEGEPDGSDAKPKRGKKAAAAATAAVPGKGRAADNKHMGAILAALLRDQ